VPGDSSACREKSERNRGGRRDGFTTIGGGQKEWDQYRPPKTIGWEPTCACTPIADPIPCTVLDPFLGSGTTLYVAKEWGRLGIGNDLSAPYCELAINRLRQGVLAF
jgi:hypothetical protein